MAIVAQVWPGGGLTRVGPGTIIEVHSMAGPVPLDDRLEVRVTATSGSISAAFFCLGNKLCAGLTGQFVVLGALERVQPTSGTWIYRLHAGVEGRLAAAGTACEVWVNQMHANGTSVDTASITGLTWDPIGDPATLQAAIDYLTGTVSGPLNDILNAVRQVKTTPGQI